MKLKLCLLLSVSVIFFMTIPTVKALENDSSNLTYESSYDNQLSESDANKLWDELPEKTKKYLDDVGLGSLQWQDISNISYQNVLAKLSSITSESFSAPFASFLKLMLIILLCSLIQCYTSSMKNTSMSSIISLIGTMCICIVIVTPVLECTQDSMKAIKFLSSFMLVYIPIMAGIILSLGKGATAISYSAMMIGVGEIISQIATNLLLPLLNIFLSISIISGISTKLSYSGINNIIMKIVSWVLGIAMAIFVTLLSIQTAISTAADNASLKAVKFTISSFVPVVGSALSDALSTILGSLKMLKSGIGAFGILAVIFLFAPCLIKCLLWIISLNICSGIANIFEFPQFSNIFISVSKVLGVVIAISLSCIAIFIVSTLFMLNST